MHKNDITFKYCITTDNYTIYIKKKLIFHEAFYKATLPAWAVPT